VPKRVYILAELLSEASKTPTVQLEEKIRNETKIPWCNVIKEITIDDMNDYCTNLQKYGVSSSVARNLMCLYHEY